jgi:hypothetical protein
VANHEKDKLNVRVLAPSEHKPRHFTFPASESVGDAAASAAADFGLHPQSPSFERESDDVVLDRTITLEAAGLHNGDELELVDVGGGV